MTVQNTNTQNEATTLKILKFLGSAIKWILVLIFGIATTLLEAVLYLFKPLIKALQGIVTLYIETMHGVVLAMSVVGIEGFKIYLKTVTMYNIKHSDLPGMIKTFSYFGAIAFATIIGIVSLMIAYQGKEKIERYWIGRFLMLVLTPIFWIKDNAKLMLKLFKQSYAYRWTRAMYKRNIRPLWKKFVAHF